MFNKKTWVDRLVSFPGRRKLTDTMTGAESIVDVTREEGAVTQAGDPFNARTMNDLEERIETAVSSAETNGKPLVVTVSLSAQTFSDTVIIQNAFVTATMVVVHSVLSNVSAQSNDWTITTEAGAVKLTGTASAATTLTMYLQESR